MLFPIDVVAVLKAGLAEDRRPPDGKLHPSSHLIGSLRHAMLEVAGAPKLESDIVNDIVLKTGTMWHSYYELLLHKQNIKFKSEVKLEQWLPEGWAGTADWVFWHPEHKAWVLGDLKTQKGESIQYTVRDGAKAEHLWQLSAYWYALEQSGVPLLNNFGVLYLPKNQVAREKVEPVLIECSPLPRDLVLGRMAERWELTQNYMASISLTPGREARRGTLAWYVTDKLAPVQPREQRVTWNAKQACFDLKLVPHWSAAYCPFPTELCDCSLQGVTKIGDYDLDGHYEPRNDYSNIIPLVEPTEADYRKRIAA